MVLPMYFFYELFGVSSVTEYVNVCPGNCCFRRGMLSDHMGDHVT